MNKKLLKILITKSYHISFAESCTGGLATSYLVDIPNASKVLGESIISYSEESKISNYKIDANIINKYGVVSEKVALLMAKGIVMKTKAEVGVGITGYAKEFGKVCIAYYINGKTYTETKEFDNLTRNEIRKQTVTYIYTRLVDLLDK